jgi:hypothetical protein
MRLVSGGFAMSVPGWMSKVDKSENRSALRRSQPLLKRLFTPIPARLVNVRQNKRVVRNASV